EVTDKLHNAKYWKRPLSEWNLNTYEQFYAEQHPKESKESFRRVLGKEIEVLKKHLKRNSKEGLKLSDLKSQLKVSIFIRFQECRDIDENSKDVLRSGLLILEEKSAMCLPYGRSLLTHTVQGTRKENFPPKRSNVVIEEAEGERASKRKRTHCQSCNVFDKNEIIKNMLQESKNEWLVCNINVTKKFHEYQQKALEKLHSTGLTWHDTYEILALSSIMVLDQCCPYSNFTNEEWQMIIETNPYTIREPVLSTPVSNAFHEAVIKHLSGQDSYMHPDETLLSRASSRTFNELRENVPNIAPRTMSEQEHCSKFLHPFINPIFLRRNKDYEVRLDRSVKGTKLRPDLSCTVDGISVLNSEIKPLGCGPLNQKKDIVKSHLQAGKTINQFLSLKGGPEESAIFLNCGDIVQTYIMDLQYDGIYRSWAYLKSKLVIDELSLPLVESNFAHFVALEGANHTASTNSLCAQYSRFLSDQGYCRVCLEFLACNRTQNTACTIY
ncbi:12043_t:CDS:2, partial [Funneliformis caledonium]